MRLTKKNYEDDTLKLKNGKTQGQYNNELWQYVKEHEDIEDELDIDLITLFKALNNRILWFIDYEKTNFGQPYDFNLCDAQFDFTNKYIYVPTEGEYYFKDYGKTWALTKEELEK